MLDDRVHVGELKIPKETNVVLLNMSGCGGEGCGCGWGWCLGRGWGQRWGWWLKSKEWLFDGIVFDTGTIIMFGP